jgi:hypothetical protein
MLLHPEGVERVQPAVSTPGTPSHGDALKGRQIKRRHNTGQTCSYLSPFQGETFVWMVPWAESYSPCGQKTSKQPLFLRRLEMAYSALVLKMGLID